MRSMSCTATINRMKKLYFILLILTAVILTACNTNSIPTRAPEPTPLAASTDDSRTLYTVIPDSSSISFAVGETLKGVPITAVGSTSYIDSRLLLDMDNLAETIVAPIEIDAASFRTDDPNRDRAINKWLLVSRAYPVIRFTPTAVNNLSSTAEIGTPITFEIEGDLLLTTYTQPVTFSVTATAVDEGRIEGTAVGSILRDDFKLRIPSAPGVADVGQTIALTFDFVALSD